MPGGAGRQDAIHHVYAHPGIFLDRAAHACVSPMDCFVRSQLAGVSTHSSNTIMMSAPRAICTCIECSGEKKCFDPSTCERNSTPSSVTLRSSDNENTWNPPESV